jgi:CheY-like chemotaxis protein
VSEAAGGREAQVDPDMVLVVEDNPTDVFVIREVLDGCGLGFRVHIARDGQEALTYLREIARDESAVCPALMLLDLNVPRVSGIEVLRELRTASRCSRMPVIVVTSSSAETDRRATEQLRADAYFKKPADLKAYFELADIIKRLVGPPRKPADCREAP